MGKVLIAVDETAGSKSALTVYKTMAQETNCVTLVHVQRLGGKSMMIDMQSRSELETLKESMRGLEQKEAHNQTSEEIMSFYKKELEARGPVQVNTQIREGIPSEEILKAAQEEKVDLIVMGCSGKTVFQRLVSGCTTKEVERHSTVPVLVAKKSRCEKSIEFSRKESKAYAA